MFLLKKDTIYEYMFFSNLNGVITVKKFLSVLFLISSAIHARSDSFPSQLPLSENSKMSDAQNVPQKADLGPIKAAFQKLTPDQKSLFISLNSLNIGSGAARAYVAFGKPFRKNIVGDIMWFGATFIANVGLVCVYTFKQAFKKSPAPKKV